MGFRNVLDGSRIQIPHGSSGGNTSPRRVERGARPHQRPGLRFLDQELALFATCRRAATAKPATPFGTTVQHVITAFDLVRRPHDAGNARAALQTTSQALVCFAATNLQTTPPADRLVVASAFYCFGRLIQRTNERDTAIVTPFFQAMGDFAALIDERSGEQSGATLWQQDRFLLNAIRILKPRADPRTLTSRAKTGIVHVAQRVGLVQAGRQWATRVALPNLTGAIHALYPDLDVDTCAPAALANPAEHFGSVRGWDTSRDAALDYALVRFLSSSAAEARQTGKDTTDARLTQLRVILAAPDADNHPDPALDAILALSPNPDPLSRTNPSAAAFLRAARQILQ
ncbi:MAG: hypothetical protein HY696_04315 [Deltaproteobacteria bacterium]|nr:hypothetical protein [Deltaproteobacteria bacterium]